MHREAKIRIVFDLFYRFPHQLPFIWVVTVVTKDGNLKTVRIKRELEARFVRKTLCDIKRVLQVLRIITDYHSAVRVHE